MSFKPGSVAPLILYPAVGAEGYPDFGFVLGVPGSPTGWSAGGGAPPTAVTGEGESIGKCIRFNTSGANNGYVNLNHLSPVPSIQPSSTDPYYIYIRAKSKSGNDYAYIEIYLDFYNAADAYLATKSALLSCGLDLKNDNVHRIFRFPITSIPSTAAKIAGILGALNVMSAQESFVDWIYFGHALDFSELGQAEDGARFMTHLPERVKTPAVISTIPQGYVEQVTWQGRAEGGTDIAWMDDAGVAKYERFLKETGAATRLSVMEKRTVLAEHYMPLAVQMNTKTMKTRAREGWKATLNLATTT